MTETVSDRAVAAWAVGELDSAQARTLVTALLSREGFGPWPDMELDCLPRRGTTLILARPARQGRCAFRFADLEDLLAAVLPWDSPPEAALGCLGEGYALFLPADTRLPPALYEFGEPAQSSAAVCRWGEDCAWLLPEDAIRQLRDKFT